MPRFVILEHDHPRLHWDLMLQTGDALRTWRLASPPTRGCEGIAATAIVAGTRSNAIVLVNDESQRVAGRSRNLNPMSASSIEAYGPARIREKSATSSPARGPVGRSATAFLY